MHLMPVVQVDMMRSDAAAAGDLDTGMDKTVHVETQMVNLLEQVAVAATNDHLDLHGFHVKNTMIKTMAAMCPVKLMMHDEVTL